jgi:hypothetical protein
MLRPLLLAALLLTATAASAQVYKWTDAQGTVHYSQLAPPQGTKYKTITTTGAEESPVPPPPASQPDAEPAPAAAAAPMTDTPENRAKLCGTLKANLDALNGAGPVVMQVSGQSKALNADERKQQVAAAQSQFQQYCSTAK